MALPRRHPPRFFTYLQLLRYFARSAVLTKRQNSTPFVWTHAAEADPANSNLMPHHEGIALNGYDFTLKILLEYSEGAARKENSNAICYFVDSSVLLLSTIYEVVIVVGLLMYATLSQVLSLLWMVVITPATLWIGVATSFLAGKPSTFLVGRFFMELAPGFVFEINNRLIEEFAPKRARAKLLCWNKLSYVGSMAAYSIAYHTSSWGYQWILVFRFLFIFLFYSLHFVLLLQYLTLKI